MIKPICTPSRVAERPSSEACLEPAVEERMLFSKRIYRTPTRTIKNPPASLRNVRSAHDYGIEICKRRSLSSGMRDAYSKVTEEEERTSY